MLQWALLGLFVIFIIITYIVVQGTRAALAWREAAAKGDTKVIGDIVRDCLDGWRSQKRPKPVPIEIWRGIQSLQLIDVAADYIRVTATAESEYKMADGRWIEMRNPLQEGIGITAKAAEMLFYELPHYQPDRLQIDVYTSFRDDAGVTGRECILSTETTREVAREVDWEEWTAEQIVDELGGRFRLSDTGRPLAIEVAPVPEREPEAEAEATASGAAEARS
ncbi:MAG TPA: hypothetical protein VMR52_09190 [Dehalococcoidia bacterium]|nr:hypothetical protein [Dehalococcoidia bacterium]